MFERSGLQRTVAGPGPVPAPDLPARWVEPPAEVVAVWAAMDACLGEPEHPADYAQAAAARLDDFHLVELIAQLEREASQVRARQLAAIEVLSRRASMNPYWPVPVAQPNVAGEEVAAALGSPGVRGVSSWTPHDCSRGL